MATVNRMKAGAASLGNGGLEEFEKDVEALLRENQHQRRTRAAAAAERERELNIFRSGSAPPTVEGARNAIGSLCGDTDPDFAQLDSYVSGGVGQSEEEVRSQPAYLSYYYSNENLSPRLPPPALSKEDWRVAQRCQVGASGVGRFGDGRKEVVGVGIADGSNSSLFSLQPGPHMRDVDVELTGRRIGSQRSLVRQSFTGRVEHGSDGMIGLAGVGLGIRGKSFSDALEEEIGRSLSIRAQLSRPGSRNDFVNVDDPVGFTDTRRPPLQDSLKTAENLKSEASSRGLVRVQSLGSAVSHPFASFLDSSLMRSTTPDPPIVGRSSSPCLPVFGGREDIPSSGASTCMAAPNDIAAAFSGLNLMKNRLLNEDNDVQGASLQVFTDKTENLFNISNNQNSYMQQNVMKSAIDTSSISSFPMLSKKIGATDGSVCKLSSDGHINLPKRITSANVYPKVPSGSAISNVDFPGSYVSVPLSQRLPTSMNSHIDADIVGQYLSTNGGHTGSGIQAPIVDPLLAQHLQLNDSATNAVASLGRNLDGSLQMDMPAYQNACLKALLAQHKLQYELPFLGKSSVFNHGYYGTSSSLAGVSAGSWNSEYGVMEEGFSMSLLDEFKSNKCRSFELSDIVGHVVEFSADQYGSRFIQQKLETASVEEKNEIFPEIFPHARALMTDVFGNYVIQKFLEHGSESQKKQLSSQLIGHVLQLSLQMYGCRVIQKALEVIDVDQQTQIVLELDGSVMKCVRDQNGNHVIQKCIECVPQEKIQFIISAFYGQVVPLSTHPYGCRVIQRVLEHCNDAKTQSIMMNEILQAVCALAQDQYGNYVVQHVLQHGKQEERTAIINKLAGQIVKMSQQKFASNVVEKCLTYGTPEERQFLINEMLGSTDENEPLQAMMKDQFGNYVVQKALETCDDKNRELILSRIKAHVNALKRFTYGKHIAARVEKVISAGERRIGMPPFIP